jgi:hypothetical protein
LALGYLEHLTFGYSLVSWKTFVHSLISWTSGLSPVS